MAEYIEREQAYTLAKKICDAVNSGTRALFLGRDILDWIDDIPAADVRPVRKGKWVTPTVIAGRAFNIPHCSVCDGVPCGVDEHTNFCPNCGADMREES